MAILLRLLCCSLWLGPTFADPLRLRISSSEILHEVDKRFLSFTVDPELLADTDVTSSKCTSMASLLGPAYIRVAGPSTRSLSVRDPARSLHAASRETHAYTGPDEDTPEFSKTIQFKEDENNDFTIKVKDVAKRAIIKTPSADKTIQQDVTSELFDKSIVNSEEIYDPISDQLAIAYKGKGVNFAFDADELQSFKKWADLNKFDVVFALNNNKRLENGDWDSSDASTLLALANQTKAGNITWQLGYECSEQPVEQYLEDLEKLVTLVGEYEQGQRRGAPQHWGVVAGDVTPCATGPLLLAHAPLETELLADAVFLDGNSSASEISKLPPAERDTLAAHLGRSGAPLWVTEREGGREGGREGAHATGLQAAALWLSSLGYAAANGFSVNFHELTLNDILEPSMSYYMALVYKSVVGARVLAASVEAEGGAGDLQVAAFAQCGALRGRALSGAVAVFAANLEPRAVRLAVDVHASNVTAAGAADVVQFLLTQDANGNVLINGVPITIDGNIKPLIRRFSSSKNIFLNLPPQSIGFWVLANAKFPLCLEPDIKTVTDKKVEDGDFSQNLPNVPHEDKINVANRNKRFIFQTTKETDINSNILHKLHRKGIDDVWSENHHKTKRDTGHRVHKHKRQIITDRLRSTFSTLKDEAKKDIEYFKYLMAQNKQKLATRILERPTIQNAPTSITVSSVIPKHTIRNSPDIFGNKQDKSFGAFISKIISSNADKSKQVPDEDTGVNKKRRMRRSVFRDLVGFNKKNYLSDYDFLEMDSEKNNKIENEPLGMIPVFGRRKRDTQPFTKFKINGKVQNIIKRDTENFNKVADSLANKKSTNKLKNLINIIRNTEIEPHVNEINDTDFYITKHPKSTYLTQKSMIENDRDSSIFSENPIKLNETEDSDNGTDLDIRKLIEYYKQVQYDEEIEPQSDEDSKNIVKKNNNIVKDFEYDDATVEPIEDAILLKTKFTDDDAMIDISEKSNGHGLLRSAFKNVASALNTMKNRMNKAWQMLSVMQRL